MEVRIAVLADFASITNDQKLNILGVFRQISATQVPAAHPQFKLVFQLEFNSSESGDKQVKIELVDEDGTEMLSIAGKMHVPRQPGGRAALVNQILDFAGFAFPKFGDYEFRVVLDGITACVIPLTVAQVTAPASRNQ